MIMGNLSEPFLKEGSPQQANDEISLVELLHHLIAYWKTVAAAIGLVLATALAFLVTATPTYSTALSYGHAAGGVDMLNMVPGLNYQDEEVLKELSLHLASYENFKRYISESESGRKSLEKFIGDSLSADERETIQRNIFRDKLTVRQPKGEDSALYTLELSYPQGVFGPSFVNDYFRWTLSRYKDALVARTERSITNLIRHNQAEMAASQEAYATELSNRITQLREADEIRLAELHDSLKAENQSVLESRKERVRVLKEAEEIAARLGIEKPTTPYELGRHEASRDVIYAEINSQGNVPLYFMGTLALSAEREILEANLRDGVKTVEIRNIEKEISQLKMNRTIETLLSREVNSPFDEHYTELEKKNTLLRSYLLSTEDLEIAEVAQWAYQPDASDSPRAAITLALALILGGILGLLCAAFNALWKKARALQAAS
jgi:LPS O-antigen subunit length determinant protein (WzzB/FepE family)